MSAQTPNAKNHTHLTELASRYVMIEELPWKPTPYPGVEIKVLMEDPDSGLLTALFRWQPGATLPLHEHQEIEQSFVLEGSLSDQEGEVTAGNYVWRPSGSRHVATSEQGALILTFFLKPNQFLDQSVDDVDRNKTDKDHLWYKTYGS